MRPSCERFWLLRPPDRRQAEWDEGMIWRREDYPESAGSGPYVGWGGSAKRLTELRIKLVSTRTPDLVWTAWDLLVQDRVAQMFKEQGFTGFELRPASVRWKVGKPDFDRTYDDDDSPGISTRDALRLEIPTLWELLVIGWGGLAPPESGMRPVPGSSEWEGIPNWAHVIDASQWDGSDFFMVWPYPLFRIVTDRVARFIKKHKLTGAKLIAPERYRRHPWLIPGADPGRLSELMPEPRAREIGEPLGIY